MMAEAVRILVWSDYVCPFCYLELPVLDRLREELGDAVSIDWRAFELRPEPAPTLDPDGEYLNRVWNASVYPMAQERGMTLRLPPVQPRSRRALEAAEFAREAGRFDEMHHALFAAFFEEGRDIAASDVLLDIGASVGLDREALQAALNEGRYTAKVLEDQRLAHEVGIAGVPGMVVTAGEQGYLMSGAQPYDAVRQAVELAAQLVAAPFERATYS
jgi:predicted DsbA family dithiol-disulfide isomerase